MLGLMVATYSVVPLGLHMWLLQYWLKAHFPFQAWRLGLLRMKVTQSFVKVLALWKDPHLFRAGADLVMVSRRKVVRTDGSNTRYVSRRVEAPAPEGSDDLECLREGRGRSLRLRRKLSLANFLKQQGCSSPLFAFPTITLLPHDIRQVREDRCSVFLVKPVVVS